MRLLFKQRMFSWFDSYDIYNEGWQKAFVVKGQLSWGHCLKVYDSRGFEVGTLKEKLLSWLPRFEIYVDGQYKGCISKEFSFVFPRYCIECMDWRAQGSIAEWDYSIRNGNNDLIAIVKKEIFNWTDTYVLDVVNPADGLMVLMFVLAIDAEKCSRNNH